MRIVRLLRAFLASSHRMRFAASRALFHTGLAPRFVMTRGGIRYRFWPSSMSMTLWADPDYASWDREVVRAVVRPGDFVVDVGANIGFVALESSRAAGPAGRVVAYEPHPRIFGYLRENMKLNSWARVDVRCAAAGARSGVIRVTDDTADDQNRVVIEGGLEVPVVRLDDDIEAVPVRFLKVDVEGFEVEVLRGSGRLLERTYCVYVEVAAEHLERFGRDVEELLSILADAGFATWTRRGTGRFFPVLSGRDVEGCANVLGVRCASEGVANRESGVSLTELLAFTT